MMSSTSFRGITSPLMMARGGPAKTKKPALTVVLAVPPPMGALGMEAQRCGQRRAAIQQALAHGGRVRHFDGGGNVATDTLPTLTDVGNGGGSAGPGTGGPAGTSSSPAGSSAAPAGSPAGTASSAPGSSSSQVGSNIAGSLPGQVGSFALSAVAPGVGTLATGVMGAYDAHVANNQLTDIYGLPATVDPWSAALAAVAAPVNAVTSFVNSVVGTNIGQLGMTATDQETAALAAAQATMNQTQEDDLSAAAQSFHDNEVANGQTAAAVGNQGHAALGNEPGTSASVTGNAEASAPAGGWGDDGATSSSTGTSESADADSSDSGDGDGGGGDGGEAHGGSIRKKKPRPSLTVIIAPPMGALSAVAAQQQQRRSQIAQALGAR